jgi:Tol biopolymer transport system component
MNIWKLPIDSNRGKVVGDIQRLTQNAAMDKAFDLSADGKKLVFLSTRSGNWDLWCKDLESGKETQLTFTPAVEEGWPQITGDGARICYNADENGKSDLYVMPSSGGVAIKIGEGWTPWDWSPDGKWFLPRRQGLKDSVALLNFSTGRRIELLKHPDYSVVQPYFSPDSRWITFGTRLGLGRYRLYIVPFRGEAAPSESDWIPITDGSNFDIKSRWSPGGNLLYFVSHRDGFRCLWAQRLDPITKRPVGAAFEVFPSHRARLSFMNVDVTGLEFSVAREKIVFNLGELTGNIWMAEFDGQH